MAFLNSNLTTTLATAGTALLSLSFVFATTAQEILGSCIFLFVKHPYDVGDRVDINSEKLTVEHIALLYSVFKRVDTHKVLQIPHVILNTNWIENISRSKAMREQIKVFINFDTTMEDINALKNEMQAFVLSKDHCRDFLPEVEVEVVGVAEMNKLELSVEVIHKVRLIIGRDASALTPASPIGPMKRSERADGTSSCVLWSWPFDAFLSTLPVAAMPSWAMSASLHIR